MCRCITGIFLCFFTLHSTLILHLWWLWRCVHNEESKVSVWIFMSAWILVILYNTILFAAPLLTHFDSCNCDHIPKSAITPTVSTIHRIVNVSGECTPTWTNWVYVMQHQLTEEQLDGPCLLRRLRSIHVILTTTRNSAYPTNTQQQHTPNIW